MNAFVLIIPIILIRYGLLSLLSKSALQRAAYFPPAVGKEKLAFVVYQLAVNVMLIYPVFLRIRFSSILNYAGLGVYVIGMILYAASTLDYAKPRENGINVNGVYRVSRNPMYVAFFLYFLGCSMLTGSWLFFAVLVVFQVAVHYIILSEERWCFREFGNEYNDYVKRVRRYF